MSGFKIVIPTNFTNGSLPTLKDDPILNAGSLVLVDVGHPASTYRGALADGDRLDNLAWREAMALVGGNQTSLKSRLEREGTAQAMWSAKGNSIQWTAGGGVGRFGAHFPLPVLEYLRANPKHIYRVSLWTGLVKWEDASNPDGIQAVSGRWSNVNFDAADGVNSIYYDLTGGAPGNVDVNGASIVNGNTTVGPRRSANETRSTGYPGPITATAAQADYWSRIFGNIQSNRGPGGGQAIFHRFYMEDLTVSGRPASDFEAIDKRLYIKEVLKSGGRYYGESYTRKY